MKIYTSYPNGITKIIKEKEFYQTEDLSNEITVYVDNTNLSEVTYSLTLEFLRADGRKTSLTPVPFLVGESTTLTEDDVTYDIHKFVLTETQLAVAGALAFTCYITIVDNNTINSRGVLFNAVSNVRKTVAYSTNTIFIVDEKDDVPIIVADMKTAIETLTGQLASKVNKADVADNLTTNDSDKVLSAKQGYILKGLIDSIQALENLNNIVGTYSELEALITIGEATEYQLNAKVQVLNDSTHNGNSTLYTLDTLDITDGLVNNFIWRFVGYYDGYNKEQIDEIINDFEQFINDNFSELSEQLEATLTEQTETINGLGELHPAGVDIAANILAKTADSGIWIGSDTGYWYYWNSSQNQYVSGGVYQTDLSYEEIDNKVNIIGDFIELEYANTKNAYINVGNKQIMNNDDRRIVWYECKPNTLYVVTKNVSSSKFVIGQSESVPANGSYLIDTPITVDSKSKTLTTYNTANYIIIYYYNNDATDPDVILASISCSEYGGAKDNYAREKLQNDNFRFSKYYKDDICLSNDYIKEWFSLAWDNREQLTEFNHLTTTAEYHTALQTLMTIYSWMGMSYEYLGKDASNLYDIYGYHISKNLWSLNTGMKRPKLIFIACQHGFEKGGAFSLYYFVKYLIYNWKTNPVLYNIYTSYDISFIPIVNPWGWNKTLDNPSTGYVVERLNSNGADLNRGYNENNLEPEQIIVKHFIENNKDTAVFFADLHTNGDTINNDNFAIKNWLSLDSDTMDASKVKNLAFKWSTYFTQNVDVRIKNQIYQCNIITYSTDNSMAKCLADSYNIPSLTFEGCNKVYNSDETYEWEPTVQAYNATQLINFINILINYYADIYNK